MCCGLCCLCDVYVVCIYKEIYMLWCVLSVYVVYNVVCIVVYVCVYVHKKG